MKKSTTLLDRVHPSSPRLRGSSETSHLSVRTPPIIRQRSRDDTRSRNESAPLSDLAAHRRPEPWGMIRTRSLSYRSVQNATVVQAGAMRADEVAIHRGCVVAGSDQLRRNSTSSSSFAGRGAGARDAEH